MIALSDVGFFEKWPLAALGKIFHVLTLSYVHLSRQ